MGVVADIAAILARDDVTADEKRHAVYVLKSNVVAAYVEGLVGRSLGLGRGYKVTFTHVPFVRPDGSLSLAFTARRAAVPVPVPMPVIIVNVPVIHAGVEDPARAIRRVLLELVERHA